MITVFTYVTPKTVAGWVFALSLTMYVLFARDKKAAIRESGRRVSEKMLLALALAGGWPGGFIGQQLLRHKTKKIIFLVRFWIAAACNTAFVDWALVGVKA